MQYYSKVRKSRFYRWSDKYLFSVFVIILLLFFVFDEGVDELEEDIFFVIFIRSGVCIWLVKKILLEIQLVSSLMFGLKVFIGKKNSLFVIVLKV